MYAADLVHPDIDLQEKLEALFLMRRDKVIDPGLTQPYQNLLAHLGNPHHHLPPVIHVAGTNGKGSVIAMMRSIFEAAGLRVHSYTSPHLTKFNERIVLAGEMISDAKLRPLVDDVLAFSQDMPLTFFEATTGLAFKAFADVPADILLLETGLGGRLDCTNVLDQPMATVMTTIGYDHMEFLGESIEDIAGEKAGIMKSGSPCFVGHQNYDGVCEVFDRKAEQLSTKIYLQDKDWQTRAYQDHFVMSDGQGDEQSWPRSSLIGDHQVENASLAIRCLQALKDMDIDHDHIATGLQRVNWPGRLQHLERTEHVALFEGLSAMSEIWFDGGHNESAAQALAAQLRQWKDQDDKALYLVLGMMGHKDHGSFIKPLVDYADQVICINVNEPTAIPAEKLSELVTTAGAQRVFTADNLKEALGSIGDKQDVRVLVCGSLYLACQMTV